MATIAPVQSWLARQALGWGVSDLARAADVSPNTVVRFERGEALKPITVDMIQGALERTGIIFIGANQGGPGVELQSRAKSRPSESGGRPSRARGGRLPITLQGESVTESKESATRGDEISQLRRQLDELRKRLDRLTKQHG
jgi:transcriptional regulator with XRE-family HTH domain